MNRMILAAPGICIVACLFTAGCSREGLAIAPVRGRVTYKEKPVVGATVTFLCPGAPRLANGTTDQNGNYQLTTYKENDGAFVGSHVVTVNIYAVEPDADVLGPDPKADHKAISKSIDDAMKRTVRQIEKAGKDKPLIPPKYADRKTSDLRKDVVKGDNVINIDLTD